MLTTKNLAILITIFNTCYSQESEDHCIYHGPDITTSDITGFSKFVLLQEEIVSFVNETEIQDIGTYFPKCCPPGYLYDEKALKCRESNDTSIYQEMSMDVNLIKIGLSDCDVIIDQVLPKSDFHLTSKINKDSSATIAGITFKFGEYCMDNVLNEETRIVSVCYSEKFCWNDSGLPSLKKCCADVKIYHVMTCSRDTSNDLKFVLSKICLILSCICLLLTMTVYSVVYKLEKVGHRVVFSYCLSLGIGFSTLAYIQFDPKQQTYCKGLSFTVLFGFLAAFAWLNTMCYDIWKTMVSMNKASDDTNKMIYYNIYGWLIPALITVFCYIEHTHEIFPDALHAHVGERCCILDNKLPVGNYGHTIFYILPILTATILNIVFFGLTIKYITNATDSIRIMRDNRIDEMKKGTRMLRANKKKIFMALKLFLVMGVNWIFEIVTSLISFKHNTTLEVIELIFDTFNCLQGVFVFAIFVLKWDTIWSILGKLKILDFTDSFSSSPIPLPSSNGQTYSTHHPLLKYTRRD